MAVKWKQGYYKWWDAYDENENKLIVPSVSKVVDMKPDPDLDKWIEEVGEEKAKIIMEAAANRGTSMHLFLENFYLAFSYKNNHNLKKALLYTQKKTPDLLLKDNIPEVSIKTGRKLFYQLLEDLGAYSKFGKVNQKNHVIKKVLGLETMIANFTLPYRGKYDINFVTRDNTGKPINVLCDYKSAGSLIKPNTIKERKMKLQLAGYWNAYEQDAKYSLDKAMLWVSTKSQGTQKISIDRKEYEDCWSEFKELCQQFHKEHNQDLSIFKDYEIIQ